MTTSGIFDSGCWGVPSQARNPERIYVPKPSGLHRPLALLHVEDQLVLQAFANLAAQRMQRHRAPLQFKVVFSNILEKPASIFFFRRWQDTYGAFQRRIRKHYQGGMRWVGDFDLAAFYDTISHELLLRTIYPRTLNDDLVWFGRCLRTWSSARAASGHGHGLPQGPLASDFLAECFLIPIDLALQKRRGYMRYVDDVRLFGATEDEVRAALIELERHCRERGLIPQAGKFAIKRVQNVQEAMGMLPSISDPQHEASTEKIDKNHALRVFRSAIGGKPYRVVDKTRLRYVLYRAEPNSDLLNLVLRLIPHHPEHADAFFAYLGRFDYRKPIERLCLSLVQKNPYPYVRGEAWHVLSRYRREARSMTAKDPRALTTRAVNIAIQRKQENFVERWGACHFLCVSEQLTSSRYSRFLKYQAPLLQSFLAPVLPDGAFTKGEVVETYLEAYHARTGTLGVLGAAPARAAARVFRAQGESVAVPGCQHATGNGDHLRARAQGRSNRRDSARPVRRAAREVLAQVAWGGVRARARPPEAGRSRVRRRPFVLACLSELVQPGRVPCPPTVFWGDGPCGYVYHYRQDGAACRLRGHAASRGIIFKELPDNRRLLQRHEHASQPSSCVAPL